MALTKQQTQQKTMRECMDLRILLAQRYRRGTFRVIHHLETPKEENVKIHKKLKKDAKRLSINYDSKHIGHRDLLNYLSENGYSHFATSNTNDDIEDYDSRVVGYLRPEVMHLSNFM